MGRLAKNTRKANEDKDNNCGVEMQETTMTDEIASVDGA